MIDINRNVITLHFRHHNRLQSVARRFRHEIIDCINKMPPFSLEPLQAMISSASFGLLKNSLMAPSSRMNSSWIWCVEQLPTRT